MTNLTANTITNDPLLAAELGLLDGGDVLNKFGSRLGVDTSYATIWRGPTNNYTGNLPYGVAEPVTLVSSSTTDNTTANPALKYIIFGLDVDYKPIREIIAAHPTSGTTAVTSTLSFSRVYRIQVYQSSNRQTPNAGNVTVRSTYTGTPVLAYMPAGAGSTLQATYTIPAGVFAVVRIITTGVDANKNGQIRIRAAEVLPGDVGPFRTVKEIAFTGGPTALPTTIGALGPLDILVEAKLASGTGDVYVDTDIALFDYNWLGNPTRAITLI
jgi:hypothetical protein